MSCEVLMIKMAKKSNEGFKQDPILSCENLQTFSVTVIVDFKPVNILI